MDEEQKREREWIAGLDEEMKRVMVRVLAMVPRDPEGAAELFFNEMAARIGEEAARGVFGRVLKENEKKHH